MLRNAVNELAGSVRAKSRLGEVGKGLTESLCFLHLETKYDKVDISNRK